MASLIPPLNSQVEIVDENGKPTPYFTRLLAKLTAGTGFTTTNGQLSLAALAAKTILANKTTSTASPTACTISDILDFVTTTRGSVLFRGATGWQALAPGTGGQVLQTNGAGADPSWVAAGGGGGTNPSLVQLASAADGTSQVVLAAAPTAGNLLVAIGTHWGGITAPTSGWFVLINVTGGSDGTVICTHIVGPGESATVQPWPAVSGSNLTVFEIQNGLESLFYPFNYAGDSAGTTRSLGIGMPRTGGILLGQASSDGYNVAPTSITLSGGLTPTIGTTKIGTSAGGSPRQATPFYATGVTKGGYTATVNYAASNTNYIGLVSVVGH